jgi:ubiquinone/menaquinone biosynthesis C-methylase UbiE
MDSKTKTSWGGVAKWYEELLQGEGTYQKEVILPNLLRLLDLKPGIKVLDLACGPGFFSKEFIKKGARVTGVDISGELIEIARQSAMGAEFYVSSADKLPFIKSGSIDKAVIVLALQNIEDAGAVLKECSRALKNGGTLNLVLNHPAFRNPKVTSWGYDEKNKIQYRRVDGYLSESKAKIQMHPGENPNDITLSFHRPLQYYFKLFTKTGFVVMRLEEWNSNRKSQPGPRAKAEDGARKEIPLFLYIEAKKSLTQ